MSFVETVRNPHPGDEPCGPNPDESLEFSNFVAAADARLPRTLSGFDKKELDAGKSLETMQAYFRQSMDMRLLVLAAKYQILSNNIAGFADAVIAAAHLVEGQWEHFHPQGADDGHLLRAAVLSGLNDMPTVVLPLQAAALVMDRRLGPVTYRTVLLAGNQIKPAADEKPVDLAAARDALLKDNFEATKAAHELLGQVAAALRTMTNAFVARIGGENAPAFDKLEAVLSGIAEFLAAVVREREPIPAPAIAEEAAGAAGQSQDRAASVETALALASAADAAAALRAVEAYYASVEPSNPALLLVRLAQQINGRSFVEAMEILSPATAAKTTIKIAGDWPMSLNFEQLKGLSARKPDSPAAGDSVAVKPVEVATRQQALAAIADVEAYFRRHEPSSPIPFLLEKARRFTGADFRELLRDIMNPA